MTVEEKSKQIRKWCSEQADDCDGCILQERSHCFGFVKGDEESEWIIHENYELVFGKEEHESDAVNHPNHYQGKNECIDVMAAMFGKEAVKHFCMCNAFKYRFRADKKNGEEDIKKAEWYETKLIEMGGIDG